MLHHAVQAWFKSANARGYRIFARNVGDRQIVHLPPYAMRNSPMDRVKCGPWDRHVYHAPASLQARMPVAMWACKLSSGLGFFIGFESYSEPNRDAFPQKLNLSQTTRHELCHP